MDTKKEILEVLIRNADATEYGKAEALANAGLVMLPLKVGERYFEVWKHGEIDRDTVDSLTFRSDFTTLINGQPMSDDAEYFTNIYDAFRQYIKNCIFAASFAGIKPDGDELDNLVNNFADEVVRRWYRDE